MIKNKKSAFTLIELSATVVIVGVLVVGVMSFSGGIINTVKSFKEKYPSFSYAGEGNNAEGTSALLTPKNLTVAPTIDGEGYYLISATDSQTHRIKASSTYGGRHLWNVFDGANNWADMQASGYGIGWASANTNPTSHIIYDFGQNYVINKIEFWGYGEGSVVGPTSYKFYSSDNGISWTEYSSLEGMTNTNDQLFTDEVEVASRYLKLEFTTTTYTLVGINELKIYGYKL